MTTTTAVAVPKTGTAVATTGSFDYSKLTAKKAKALQVITDEVRKNQKTHIVAGINIGILLNKAKEALGHGLFEDWLRAEFRWSESTCRNYMNAALHFGDKTPIVGHLRPTTVYKLAEKSTPPAVREAIVKRLEAKEEIADAEIIEEVKAAKPAPKPKPVTSTSTAAPAATPTPAKAGPSAPVTPPDNEIAAEGFVRALHAMAGVRFDEMMDLLARTQVATILKARSKVAVPVAPASTPAVAPASTPSVEEIEAALSDDAAEAESTPAKAAAEASEEPETSEASAADEIIEAEFVETVETAAADETAETITEEAPPAAEAETRDIGDDDDETPEDDEIDELELKEMEDTRAGREEADTLAA